MIIGVGTDVVDVARFEESLVRTPTLRERLFTPAEALLPPASLAARFAAKEAIAKALGAPAGLAWHDAGIASLAANRAASEAGGSAASAGVNNRSRSPGVRVIDSLKRSMSTTSMPTPTITARSPG